MEEHMNKTTQVSADNLSASPETRAADGRGPSAHLGKETKVPCEVYSRIVGYLRPVQNWNRGKKQEFAARTTYRIKEQIVE
jgi:hypothetical protein